MNSIHMQYILQCFDTIDGLYNHSFYSLNLDGILQFYILLSSISVISGQQEGDIERLCAMELCL